MKTRREWILGILLVIASAQMCGCKDDSGSADVKPNPAMSNRYKQNGHGAPPGAGPGAATNTAPQ